MPRTCQPFVTMREKQLLELEDRRWIVGPKYVDQVWRSEPVAYAPLPECHAHASLLS